ncbi:hypothetical protein CRUP_009020, partial [Coryphaenoides rupestris]
MAAAQGRHATRDEITACAYQAVNVDNQFNGAPIQVRVVMGKEPRHFLAIFKGKLIIFEATEVPARASSLNTNDVFLLRTDAVCYLWYGKGCNGDERLMGKAMSDVLSKQDKQVVIVSDNSGKLVVQEVASQPLTQDLLRSTDCYIADQGGSSVMVWKGKQASPEERRSALSNAVGFIKAKNYPASTNVEVMSEGGESAIFKHLFKSWNEKNQTQGLGSTYSTGKIAKVEQHSNTPAVTQGCALPGQVWRIEQVELAEVNPSTYGQFYGGDCYLVLYTYQRSNRPQYILYMWQGRHATRDEITACAYQAVNVDNQFNGAPIQVRVVMGKEPRHFLAIFKGKLIIFEVRLVVEPANTLATEVPARASSLNTNDVFLLRTDAGCNGDERLMGKAMSDGQAGGDGSPGACRVLVALGGKAPYASDKRLQKEEPLHAPRLFECSNQTGCFQMTEVDDFTQTDLDEEDVMLLDTWEEVFLWIGSSANQHETQEACNSAREYLRTHPAGRDPDTPLITVKQGCEPPTFTGWFNAWDPHKWSVSGRLG